MLAPLRLALATLLVALLSGCAGTVSAAPEPASTELRTESAAPSECTQAVQLQIESAIRSQTQAFAAEDFELAYSYASDTFRSNVPIRSFVAIIASSYGPLLSSSQLEFSNCFSNQALDLGIIEVRFVESGLALYGLRYIVSESDEGWRVEGASNLELIATGS
jgi:hypothetical protein